MEHGTLRKTQQFSTIRTPTDHLILPKFNTIRNDLKVMDKKHTPSSTKKDIKLKLQPKYGLECLKKHLESNKNGNLEEKPEF